VNLGIFLSILRREEDLGLARGEENKVNEDRGYLRYNAPVMSDKPIKNSRYFGL